MPASGPASAVPPAYGTVQNAIAYTSLSRSTIERLIAEGKLPARRVGRRVILAFRDLDALLQPAADAAE